MSAVEVLIFALNIKNKMKEPVIILLVLFVLLGLAYEPMKKSARENSANDSITGATQNSGYSVNKNISDEIRNAQEETKRLEESLNKEIEKSKRSPYYDKISLSGISGLNNKDPNEEYVTISARLDKNETLKITGWYLKSEISGYFAVISGASLLPFPFKKSDSPIVLQDEDRVYLIKGFSPVGVSFRTNKCTGYFEENRTFVPSLSLNCPQPEDERLPNFSSVYDRNEECFDIIDSLSRCVTVNSSFIRDLPDTVNDACKNYLTTQINYNSCVAKHFGDVDFPGNEYYVYLNKFGPLWRERQDKINLYDENGLIVDTISY